jgi:hypothetical protein
MSYIIINDEGSALSTPFVKGKKLSLQLKEERDQIARDREKRKYRPKITEIKGDVTTKSGWFLKRAEGILFDKPHREMPALEREILSYFATQKTFKDRVRHQELIAAKRLFIFFAQTYLKLTSQTIAHYLDLERSTISHHCQVVLGELDIYPQYQHVALCVDNYLYSRAYK